MRAVLQAAAALLACLVVALRPASASSPLRGVARSLIHDTHPHVVYDLSFDVTREGSVAQSLRGWLSLTHHEADCVRLSFMCPNRTPYVLASGGATALGASSSLCLSADGSRLEVRPSGAAHAEQPLMDELARTLSRLLTGGDVSRTVDGAGASVLNVSASFASSSRAHGSDFRASPRRSEEEPDASIFANSFNDLPVVSETRASMSLMEREALMTQLRAESLTTVEYASRIAETMSASASSSSGRRFRAENLQSAPLQLRSSVSLKLRCALGQQSMQQYAMVEPFGASARLVAVCADPCGPLPPLPEEHDFDFEDAEEQAGASAVGDDVRALGPDARLLEANYSFPTQPADVPLPAPSFLQVTGIDAGTTIILKKFNDRIKDALLHADQAHNTQLAKQIADAKAGLDSSVTAAETAAAKISAEATRATGVHELRAAICGQALVDVRGAAMGAMSTLAGMRDEIQGIMADGMRDTLGEVVTVYMINGGEIWLKTMVPIFEGGLQGVSSAALDAISAIGDAASTLGAAGDMLLCSATGIPEADAEDLIVARFLASQSDVDSIVGIIAEAKGGLGTMAESASALADVLKELATHPKREEFFRTLDNTVRLVGENTAPRKMETSDVKVLVAGMKTVLETTKKLPGFFSVVHQLNVAVKSIQRDMAAAKPSDKEARKAIAMAVYDQLMPHVRAAHTNFDAPIKMASLLVAMQNGNMNIVGEKLAKFVELTAKAAALEEAATTKKLSDSDAAKAAEQAATKEIQEGFQLPAYKLAGEPDALDRTADIIGLLQGFDKVAASLGKLQQSITVMQTSIDTTVDLSVPVLEIMASAFTSLGPIAESSEPFKAIAKTESNVQALLQFAQTQLPNLAAGLQKLEATSAEMVRSGMETFLSPTWAVQVGDLVVSILSSVSIKLFEKVFSKRFGKSAVMNVELMAKASVWLQPPEEDDAGEGSGSGSGEEGSGSGADEGGSAVEGGGGAGVEVSDLDFSVPEPVAQPKKAVAGAGGASASLIEIARRAGLHKDIEQLDHALVSSRKLLSTLRADGEQQLEAIPQGAWASALPRLSAAEMARRDAKLRRHIVESDMSAVELLELESSAEHSVVSRAEAHARAMLAAHTGEGDDATMALPELRSDFSVGVDVLSYGRRGRVIGLSSNPSVGLKGVRGLIPMLTLLGISVPLTKDPAQIGLAIAEALPTKLLSAVGQMDSIVYAILPLIARSVRSNSSAADFEWLVSRDQISMKTFEEVAASPSPSLVKTALMWLRVSADLRSRLTGVPFASNDVASAIVARLTAADEAAVSILQFGATFMPAADGLAQLARQLPTTAPTTSTTAPATGGAKKFRSTTTRLSSALEPIAAASTSDAVEAAEPAAADAHEHAHHRHRRHHRHHSRHGRHHRRRHSRHARLFAQVSADGSSDLSLVEVESQLMAPMDFFAEHMAAQSEADVLAVLPSVFPALSIDASGFDDATKLEKGAAACGALWAMTYSLISGDEALSEVFTKLAVAEMGVFEAVRSGTLAQTIRENLEAMAAHLADEQAAADLASVAQMQGTSSSAASALMQRHQMAEVSAKGVESMGRVVSGLQCATRALSSAMDALREVGTTPSKILLTLDRIKDAMSTSPCSGSQSINEVWGVVQRAGNIITDLGMFAVGVSMTVEGVREVVAAAKSEDPSIVTILEKMDGVMAGLKESALHVKDALVSFRVDNSALMKGINIVMGTIDTIKKIISVVASIAGSIADGSITLRGVMVEVFSAMCEVIMHQLVYSSSLDVWFFDRTVETLRQPSAPLIGWMAGPVPEATTPLHSRPATALGVLKRLETAVRMLSEAADVRKSSSLTPAARKAADDVRIALESSAMWLSEVQQAVSTLSHGSKGLREQRSRLDASRALMSKLQGAVASSSDLADALQGLATADKSAVGAAIGAAAAKVDGVMKPPASGQEVEWLVKGVKAVQAVQPSVGELLAAMHGALTLLGDSPATVAAALGSADNALSAGFAPLKTLVDGMREVAKAIVGDEASVTKAWGATSAEIVASLEADSAETARALLCSGNTVALIRDNVHRIFDTPDELKANAITAFATMMRDSTCLKQLASPFSMAGGKLPLLVARRIENAVQVVPTVMRVARAALEMSERVKTLSDSLDDPDANPVTVMRVFLTWKAIYTLASQTVGNLDLVLDRAEVPEDSGVRGGMRLFLTMIDKAHDLIGTAVSAAAIVADPKPMGISTLEDGISKAALTAARAISAPVPAMDYAHIWAVGAGLMKSTFFDFAKEVKQGASGGGKLSLMKAGKQGGLAGAAAALSGGGSSFLELGASAQGPATLDLSTPIRQLTSFTELATFSNVINSERVFAPMPAFASKPGFSIKRYEEEFVPTALSISHASARLGIALQLLSPTGQVIGNVFAKMLGRTNALSDAMPSAMNASQAMEYIYDKVRSSIRIDEAEMSQYDSAKLQSDIGKLIRTVESFTGDDMNFLAYASLNSSSDALPVSAAEVPVEFAEKGRAYVLAMLRDAESLLPAINSFMPVLARSLQRVMREFSIAGAYQVMEDLRTAGESLAPLLKAAKASTTIMSAWQKEQYTRKVGEMMSATSSLRELLDCTVGFSDRVTESAAKGFLSVDILSWMRDAATDAEKDNAHDSVMKLADILKDGKLSMDALPNPATKDRCFGYWQKGVPAFLVSNQGVKELRSTMLWMANVEPSMQALLSVARQSMKTARIAQQLMAADDGFSEFNPATVVSALTLMMDGAEAVAQGLAEQLQGVTSHAPRLLPELWNALSEVRRAVSRGRATVKTTVATESRGFARTVPSLGLLQSTAERAIGNLPRSLMQGSDLRGAIGKVLRAAVTQDKKMLAVFVSSEKLGPADTRDKAIESMKAGLSKPASSFTDLVRLARGMFGLVFTPAVFAPLERVEPTLMAGLQQAAESLVKESGDIHDALSSAVEALSKGKSADDSLWELKQSLTVAKRQVSRLRVVPLALVRAAWYSNQIRPDQIKPPLTAAAHEAVSLLAEADGEDEIASATSYALGYALDALVSFADMADSLHAVLSSMESDEGVVVAMGKTGDLKMVSYWMSTMRGAIKSLAEKPLLVFKTMPDLSKALAAAAQFGETLGQSFPSIVPFASCTAGYSDRLATELDAATAGALDAARASIIAGSGPTYDAAPLTAVLSAFKSDPCMSYVASQLPLESDAHKAAVSGLMSQLTTVAESVPATLAALTSISKTVIGLITEGDKISSLSSMRSFLQDRWDPGMKSTKAAMDAVMKKLQQGGEAGKSLVGVVKSARRLVGTVDRIVRMMLSVKTSKLRPFLQCKGGLPPMGSSYKDMRLYSKHMELFSVAIGPIIVMGVPLVVRVGVTLTIDVGLETGFCRYVDLRNEQQNYVAIAPRAGVSIGTSVTVSLGVPMFEVGVTLQVDVATFTLVLQVDVNLVRGATSVSLTPWIGAGSGYVALSARIAVFSFKFVLFRWRGLRAKLPGLCYGTNSKVWSSCPPVPNAQVRVDAALLSRVANPPERPALPAPGSAVSIAPSADATSADASQEASEDAAELATALGGSKVARPAPAAAALPAEPVCVMCQLNEAGCNEWMCPLAIQRFTRLAGMPNMVRAFHDALASTNVLEGCVWPRGWASTTQITSMAVCSEQVSSRPASAFGKVKNAQHFEELEYSAFVGLRKKGESKDLWLRVQAMSAGGNDAGMAWLLTKLQGGESYSSFTSSSPYSYQNKPGAVPPDVLSAFADGVRTQEVVRGSASVPATFTGATVSSFVQSTQLSADADMAIVSAAGDGLLAGALGGVSFKATGQCTRCNLVGGALMCPLLGRRAALTRELRGVDVTRVQGQCLDSVPKSELTELVAVMKKSGVLGSKMFVSVCDERVVAPKGEYEAWVAIESKDEPTFVRIRTAGGMCSAVQYDSSVTEAQWPRDKAIPLLYQAFYDELMLRHSLATPCKPNPGMPSDALLSGESLREVVARESPRLSEQAAPIAYSSSLCIACDDGGSPECSSSDEQRAQRVLEVMHEYAPQDAKKMKAMTDSFDAAALAALKGAYAAGLGPDPSDLSDVAICNEAAWFNGDGGMLASGGYVCARRGLRRTCLAYAVENTGAGVNAKKANVLMLKPAPALLERQHWSKLLYSYDLFTSAQQYADAGKYGIEDECPKDST